MCMSLVKHLWRFEIAILLVLVEQPWVWVYDLTLVAKCHDKVLFAAKHDIDSNMLLPV